MEPLQHPPGEMQGRLKDEGLKALLKELAHTPPGDGLCLITTRLAVADLMVGSSVQEIILEHFICFHLSRDHLVKIVLQIIIICGCIVFG